MIDFTEVNELLAIANEPALAKEAGSIIILFADGEICYTKAGNLLGLRSVHQFEPPLPFRDFPVAEGFTECLFGHPCVIMDCERAAREIRNEMAKAIRKAIPFSSMRVAKIHAF
jgi:hypothetical protein